MAQGGDITDITVILENKRERRLLVVNAAGRSMPDPPERLATSQLEPAISNAAVLRGSRSDNDLLKG